MYLNISNVSALCGRHTYITKEEAWGEKNKQYKEEEKSLESIQSYKKYIKTEINPDIESVIKDVIKDVKETIDIDIIKSICYKNRGKYLENIVASKYALALPECKLYTQERVRKVYEKYTLVGYLDLFIEDENIVVEIKNRIKECDIPEYDLDQLAIYMVLYKSNKKVMNIKGQLAEQTNGKLRITNLSYDDAIKRWKEMKEILDKEIVIRYVGDD
jgi:hypothetical protein